MKIVFCAPESDRPNGEGSYGYHNIRAPLLALGHEIIDVDFRAELKRLGRDGLARHVRALVDREQPELFLHMVFEDELSPDLLRYISHETSTLAVAFSATTIGVSAIRCRPSRTITSASPRPNKPFPFFSRRGLRTSF